MVLTFLYFQIAESYKKFNKTSYSFWYSRYRYLAIYVGLKVTCNYIQKYYQVISIEIYWKNIRLTLIIESPNNQNSHAKNLLAILWKKVFSSEKIKYVEKIGSIMYAMIETCINITFVTSIVSHFLKNLEPEYFNIIN